MSGGHAVEPAARLKLSALEVALGFPLGSIPAVIDRRDVRRSPLAALEAAIEPALARPPCLVSFSGGLDSSVVLAVASGLARRIGTPAPVPITWRFDRAPAAEETRWQEAVIAELGLADWERLPAGDDLDWVGPVARTTLRRHGLLYPPNAFLHAPLLARASGGSLLTGIGGDQILGGWWGSHLARLAAGARRPERRDPLRVAYALSPPRLRSRVGRGAPLASPWLTAAAERASRRVYARDVLEEPVAWAARVRSRARRRELRLGEQSLQMLAADVDTLLVSPLLEPSVCEAIAHHRPRGGLVDRRTALQVLFEDRLPRALAHRRTKALFGDVFWRHPSRALAREFDGRGVDRQLVNVAALAQAWRGPDPPARTALLLQQVWLEAESAGGQMPEPRA